MKDIARAIIQKAEELAKEKVNGIILAIDGRCGSGKSTLAKKICEISGCRIIHMDDFFLRTEQRTAERLSEPGGNFDRERFLFEALIPLSEAKIGESISYRPFDCSKHVLSESVEIKKADINIVEGSYSCHPLLSPYYDLKIFLSIDQNTQIKRIAEREGAKKADIFKAKWIPMEEKYFSFYSIADSCDLRFDL